MRQTKKSRQLPSRTALQNLGHGSRRITDYSKASPLTPEEPPPSILRGLVKPRKPK